MEGVPGRFGASAPSKASLDSQKPRRGREIRILRGPAKGDNGILVTRLTIEKHAIVILDFGLLRPVAARAARASLR